MAPGSNVEYFKECMDVFEKVRGFLQPNWFCDCIQATVSKLMRCAFAGRW